MKESYRDPADTEKDKFYILNKLGMSPDEFDNIMSLPVKSHLVYPNYHKVVKKLKWPIKAATYLGFIPLVFYEKYVK
jgi:hypothetical protein